MLAYVNLRPDHDHAPLPLWAGMVFVAIFAVLLIVFVAVMIGIRRSRRAELAAAARAGDAATVGAASSPAAAAPVPSAPFAGPPSPRFYTVNDRPVRLVSTPDGGLAGEVYDIATGGFVFDPGALALVSDHGKDIDAFDAADFAAYVGRLRTQVPTTWAAAENGEFPYAVEVTGERWTIRVNDFPAEPLYTLLVDGVEQLDLDDWPPAWTKPVRSPRRS